MKPNKACPVILRRRTGVPEILVFRHPAGDVQLVKGTIEPGELPADAAVRELAEESGLVAECVLRDLGEWDADFEGQIWSFHLCEISDQPDEWTFYTADEGGMDFQLFWHPLENDPGQGWHPVHQNAFFWIKEALREMYL